MRSRPPAECQLQPASKVSDALRFSQFPHAPEADEHARQAAGAARRLDRRHHRQFEAVLHLHEHRNAPSAPPDLQHVSQEHVLLLLSVFRLAMPSRASLGCRTAAGSNAGLRTRSPDPPGTQTRRGRSRRERWAPSCWRPPPAHSTPATSWRTRPAHPATHAAGVPSVQRHDMMVR